MKDKNDKREPSLPSASASYLKYLPLSVPWDWVLTGRENLTQSDGILVSWGMRRRPTLRHCETIWQLVVLQYQCIAELHLYNQWISWETSSLSLLPAQSQLSAVMLSTLQTRLRKTCNPGGVKTIPYNLINDMWCLQWLNGRSAQHMFKS